jgi:prepilin-type N-terminal cleavage/methylation domain-containing protein
MHGNPAISIPPTPRPTRPPSPRTTLHAPRSRSAFTLIEIMIVVAIMGILLTMGVPLVYRAYHKDSMSKAIVEVEGVLKTARARAIMQGRPVAVRFHPLDKRLEVEGSSGSGSSGGSDNTSMNAGSVGSTDSAQIPDSIKIELLFINLVEYTASETTFAMFYPNGTCDEIFIALHDDKNDYRKITTEVTTGLPKTEELIR